MFSLMVVEDNPTVRRGLIYNVHQNMPWLEVVAEASDGVSGMELALRHRPEIILTDIRLPGISGLEMIEEIQKTYLPQVVVISGYTEFEYARYALRLGVIAYLVKPIDEEELETTLHHAVAKICVQQNVSGFESRNSAQKQLRQPLKDGKNNALRRWYVDQALDYIHGHYAENIGVAEIAQALNISESHLSKLFKEETSFSLHEYRSNYRISCAAKLLVQPQYKIYEVARAVGIDDQRYFSNLFKRSMGLTPMEYRNAVLAENKEE